MSRPMASNVSTLSGFVANDHQAIHLVSSTPSKIPYGGFSPVRLQTSLTPQPPSRPLARPLIGCHCSCPRPQRFTRRRTCVQAALRPSTRTTGPVALGSPAGYSVRPAHRLLWPHLRLCWLPRRLMNYSVRLRGRPRQPQRVPNLLCPSLTPCRCPYSGGPGDCIRRWLGRWFCLRHFVIGSTTTGSTNPEPVDRLTKLQHSHNGAAWSLACPAPVRTFTTELAWAGSPQTQVGYD